MSNELPMAMLAFISTVVFSVLDDWSTGEYKKSSFEGKQCADAYKRNIDFLHAIKKVNNGKKYHVLMHKLFKLVTGQGPVSRVNASTDADLAALDLDNMPDELD
ncbi:hypothetical protein C8Q72DRAFT_414462 [Fomitopsis betulina]|nr:hypothetical protein C8Q72DRAFT_414462 [Fomitopsis betulina]